MADFLDSRLGCGAWARCCSGWRCPWRRPGCTIRRRRVPSATSSIAGRSEASTAVQSQLQNCGLLVRTVQALFLASDQVTSREFDSIYSNLRPHDLFPSLQAMAYSERRVEPESDRE